MPAIEAAIERMNNAHIRLTAAYAATDGGRRPNGWRQAIDDARAEKLAAQEAYRSAWTESRV